MSRRWGVAFGIAAAMTMGTALAQQPAEPEPPAQEEERPAGDGAFRSERLACDRVVLTWFGDDEIARGPASQVTVENEVGNTGLRFLVDRENGTIVGVQTWRVMGGVRSMTFLPGSPRVDYENCQDADPIGGILVEYVDVRDARP